MLGMRVCDKSAFKQIITKLKHTLDVCAIGVQELLSIQTYLSFREMCKMCCPLSLIKAEWRKFALINYTIVDSDNGLSPAWCQAFAEPMQAYYHLDPLVNEHWFKITGVSIVAQPFAQTQSKENIKAPRHWPLWRGIQRWPVKIPSTKGQ